jgi:LmbE family N-acetylglucosaminyl deacetylase
MTVLHIGKGRSGPRRVLCLGAHSDDIEIGAGGMVLELRRQRSGVQFQWVVFSAAGVRAAEARQSARRFLGPGSTRQVRLFSFRDGFFPSEYPGIKETFEQIARSFQPDLILTHTRDDRHQDHRVVSDLTWNTFRRHLILEYEIPKWDGDLGRPNGYLPLSLLAARRKTRLLMLGFASQRSKDWFSPETFLGLMRLRGVECRAPGGYAEAYHLRKATLEI